MSDKDKIKKYPEPVIVEATISKIDFKNQLVGDKLKTVFYCPSYYAPEGRMCVIWGRVHIEVGDKIVMKGRFSDGVFIARSLNIIMRFREEGA